MTGLDVGRSGPVEHAAWRGSSYSGGGNDCVEVALITDRAAVRDSKDPEGPVLRFGRDGWHRLLAILVGGS